MDGAVINPLVGCCTECAIDFPDNSKKEQGTMCQFRPFLVNI
jgi:hypothetical protein